MKFNMLEPALTHYEDEQQYPAYFTARNSDEGRLDVFHISPSRERAEEWRKANASKDAERKAPISEKLPTSDQTDSVSETTFQTILESFVRSIKSFYDLMIVNAQVRMIFPGVFIEQEFNEFSKSHLPMIGKDGSYTIYGIPDQHVSAINKKIQRLDHLREGIATLPDSVLMGLVARYDAAVGSLVRFMLSSRKDRLGGNDKTISVREVLAAASFDDLVNDLVDDEIYSLMRGSHDDQVKYVESSFSIQIRSGFPRYAAFLEIFERRNLVAHGETHVNARYLKMCKQAGVLPSDRLETGSAVKLTDKYLRHAADTLLEFGALMIWWLWLKQHPAQAEDAYVAISNVTYDLIIDRRFRLAASVLESTLSRDTKGAPETMRRMMAVNMANCHKHLNDDDSFEKALSLFDWSASADHYRISVASLRGDINEVCSLIPRVTDEAVVGKSGLRDWPVFEWVRKEPEFVSKFQETFGEPLTMTAEIDDEVPIASREVQ